MVYGLLGENATPGERVRYYRKRRGVSQEKLAKWVGVSRGVISRLELENRLPSSEVMLLIALRLDIPPVYIFRGGRYSLLIYLYVHGKTVVSQDNGIKNFSFVRIISDFCFEFDKCLCVSDGERRYLVYKGVIDKGARCLCSDDNGVCFICAEKDNKFVAEGDLCSVGALKVIGSIIDDVTDMTVPVIM